MPAQVIAVLLVVGCVASVMAAGRWVKTQEEALRRLPRPPVASGVAARPFESLDLEDLRLIKEITPTAVGALPTNPFSPARVPPPVVGEHGPSATTPQPPPKPQWLYKGVVMMGGERRAVIEEVTSGETTFVKLGESLGEFKVLDIAEDRVVLSNPKEADKQHILELVE